MNSNSTSIRPKSILKYRPECNIDTPLSPIPTTTTATNSNNSWFSRLQSKLYSNTNASINEEDTEEYKRSLTLPKQDLRKVTFSVGNLVTEHPFYFGDSPRDEEYEKEKQAAAAAAMAKLKELKTLEVVDLAGHYEHACIQREEGTIDRFRNILRASRTSQLKSIDLSKEPIATHQAGPLSDIFMLNFGLTNMNLSDCKMNDETIRILLCSLLASNTIESLNLSGNSFNSKGFKYIAIFIKESKTIKSVDLSRCTFEKRAMQFLAQGIRHATTLKNLILSDCNMKPTPEILEIFSEGVYQSNSLKSLTFCNNHLPVPSSATWIANLIAHNDQKSTRLIDLNLSGNDLALMIPPLTYVLRNNTNLLNLNLSNCNITYQGLSFLANALAENTCLQSLDISNNPLSGETDEGILALKTALARNATLQSLNLSNTQLDSSSTIALAESFPENRCLSRLDLSKNPNIDMAGILALAISIKMNNTLTFLDINIPPSDEELANLQNDIVAVCTTNMLQKVEAQKRLEEKPHLDEITTLTPSSSSSSNSSTLDTDVVELPSEEVLMAAKKVLDGPQSPQLNLQNNPDMTSA